MLVISLLRVVVATALGLVAWFHLDLAETYTLIGDRPLSLGDQFYAQSAAAIVLAVLVLVPLVRSLGRWDGWLWLAVAAFGVVSLVPLVYSRYNPLPLPLCSGDCARNFPDGWQETWGAVHAKPTAVVEVVVIVGALLALALRSSRTRRAAPVSAA